MPFPIPQGPAGVARIGAGARSLDFLGANTYVQVPEADWCSGAFTIEAWVFARSANTWSRVMDFGNGTPEDNVLLGFYGNSGCFTLYVQDAGKKQEKHMPTKDALPLNQWVHVAATMDADGNACIYKNGELWVSDKHLVPRTVVRKLNYIGRSNWSGDQWFNGNLSEVRIWSVARTQDDLKSTMFRRLTGAEPGLKGYWRLDETRGNLMTDWSPSGKNGTLYAGPASADQGLSFNGANSFLQLPANMPVGTQGTAEMWVFARSANTWSRFFDFGDKDAADNIVLYFQGDSGKVGFIQYVGATGGTEVDSPGQLPLNEWQHLAVTWSGGTARIYRNGDLWAQGPVQNPNPNASRKNCFIGRSNWAADKYLNAIISEFRMWNRALGQQELNQPLTGRESGLVVYLKGNEINNSSVPDRSPNNRNATASNMALVNVPPRLATAAEPGAQVRFSNQGGTAWTAYYPATNAVRWPWDTVSPGYAVAQFRDTAGNESLPVLVPALPVASVRTVREVGAKALGLDGKSSFVSIPPDYWFTGAATVEAWVYTRNPAANWCRIIDFANGPGSDNVLFALAGNTGRPCFEVYQAGRSGGKVQAPDALPSSQWVHLAATLDGAGNAVLYRNGKFWCTGQTGVPRPLQRRINYIGRSNWGGDAYFDGMLADLRIWNVVRTPQQIAAGMAGDLGPDETGLLGRWLLSDGAVQGMAPDASIRKLNGTYNNPGWYNVATLELTTSPYVREMRLSPTGGVSHWTDWQAAAPAARILLRPGGYQVAVQVRDDLGQESQPVVEVAYREPPFTNAFPSGDQVALQASSNLGGPFTIYFRLNGGPETVYSTPIAVVKGQINTIEFWSEDWAGNRDDRHIYTFQA